MSFIRENLEYINAISKFNIVIVAVTKKSNVLDMQAAIDAGITDIAENRLQVAEPKFAKLDRECTKHFIGPIQTNKIKDIVRLFDVIHSVDRPKVYRKICEQAEKQKKSIKVLFQVNLTGEEQKSGFTADEFEAFLKLKTGELLGDTRRPLTENQSKFVQPIGLMAMGPMTEDTDQIRSVFKSVKLLSEKYKHLIGSEISMGMSGDYEVAFEEGATMVRLGSVLFG